MRLFRTASVLALMLGTAMLQAQGLVLVQQETRDGKTNTSQIQLDKTHMRAESQSSGETMAFMFDEGAQTARVLNIEKKTYLEINRAFMQQVQQQLSQVQEQLKNLPPEQRAVIEQAMRGRGGLPGASGAAAAQVAKLQYKQTGSDRVGKWSCTKYEAYQGPQKVMELCTVDPKELGVTAADFDVAKHLAEFLQAFLPQAANQILVPGTAADQGFSGFPIRRTSFSNGRVESVSEIKEVRHEAIPASVWEIPAGFKRENPPGR